MYSRYRYLHSKTHLCEGLDCAHTRNGLFSDNRGSGALIVGFLGDVVEETRHLVADEAQNGCGSDGDQCQIPVWGIRGDNEREGSMICSGIGSMSCGRND